VKAAAGGPLDQGTKTTRTPPVDIEGKAVPTPVDPHWEARQAYLPYRGTELHGVPSPEPWVPDAEGYGDGSVPVRYDEDQSSEHVLPVRIVSAGESETINAWRTTQLPVAGNASPPQQIVPRARNRSTVTIENTSDTDAFWIGPGPSLSRMNGYKIAAGGSKGFSTTEEIWAVSDTVNSPVAAILTEFKTTP
jgi:hypothetical protein